MEALNEATGTPAPQPEDQQQRLITVLSELEDEVEKQNSLPHVFLRGALYGLGTVIGATFLLALLASAIAVAIDQLGIGNVPYVSDFINSIQSR